MSYQKAGSFGLLEQIVEYKKLVVQWWNVQRCLDVGILKNVPVKFEQDITLLVDFLVYPPGCVVPFLLDNGTLRKYSAVHMFGKTSKIYFLPYGSVDTPYSRFEFAIKAHTDKKLRTPSIDILVDSGSTDFTVSDKFMEKMKERFPTKKIERMKLRFSNGKVLLESALRLVPNLPYDLVMGRRILEENNCILDYFSSTLYFQKKKRMYVTDLTELLI